MSNTVKLSGALEMPVNPVIPFEELSAAMIALTNDCDECRYLPTDNLIVCNNHAEDFSQEG